MKNQSLLMIAVFVFFTLFISCQPPESGAIDPAAIAAAVDARIDAFIGELNTTDRSLTYLNFYPGMTQYNDLVETYWNSELPWTQESFWLSPRGAVTDAGNGLMQVSADLNSDVISVPGEAYSDPIVFTLIEDQGQWLISVLDYGDGYVLLNGASMKRAPLHFSLQ
jgi:hypothetical protein